eukprot:365635-Chlamydomonas_euryale.AAC.2
MRRLVTRQACRQARGLQCVRVGWARAFPVHQECGSSAGRPCWPAKAGSSRQVNACIRESGSKEVREEKTGGAAFS